MIRKVLCCLLACLILPGCTKEIPAPQAEPFSAVITSDLHFTLSTRDVNSLVPLVSHSEEVLDTIISEVLDIHPDVFIATGDLTNSGRPEDARYLADRLSILRNAGISVILTTGNHDLDQSDAGMFEEIYYSLPEMYSRDTASLSYAVVCRNVMFLAMDDSTYTGGTGAALPAETMNWLKEMLKEAQQKGMPAVFLSHHSVLSPYGKNYTIENRDLYPLLKKYGVKLCLTGHQHSQSLIQKEGMTELISTMPLSGAHLIGILESDGIQAEYRAKPLDFERFGPDGFASAVAELDRQSEENSRETFRTIFSRAGMEEDKQERCIDLMARFLQAHARGNLASEAGAIRKSPDLDDMLEGLDGSNYGPWVRNQLEDPVDSDTFAISW